MAEQRGAELSTKWRALPKGLRRLLAVVATVVIAYLLLLLGVSWSYREHQTTEHQEFKVCGRQYVVSPGFTAYDYRWQGGEVPDGHTFYRVRSSEVGGDPPSAFHDVFPELPPEVSARLALPPGYSSVPNIDAAIAMLQDPLNPPDPWKQWKINYDTCSASFYVARELDIRLPRPKEWAITIYEITGSDTSVGDFLDDVRSSGAAND